MHALSQADRAQLIEARRSSLEIAQRWRDGEACRAILRRFEGGCPEALADAAEAVLAETDWAGLLAPLVAALAANPFFEPPLRVSRDAVRTGAVLIDAPMASISASLIDGRRLPSPATLIFPGYITVTRYLKAGGATLRRWETEPLAPDFSAAAAAPCRPLPPLALADDDIVRCDGRTRAQLFGEASGPILQITATIRPGAIPLIREHRIADGALVRVASADEAGSRTEMLLGYLRRMGRIDAAPRFEAATRDRAFHTRWTAMREWLGLDARSAFPRLEEMAANDPHPEVRAAAAATLATVRHRLACPA
ncbi:hypothetical protein OF829_07105 [Sphingomonas sp. LB-2]|uniref:hypothetical protein n=1 Tax=Sphingomonas caeni TaxID=2984949 RepID=UPI002232ACDD|nr:hypothetical protein [Sphingomonas caeni]MCW3847003.1 hypothetical protein [Sphingomonas caeni]